ncbi:MAG: FG-GAP repeat protein [Methanosarcinales archaeon]|nr:FG-GAP repeat protein [Methanosarcinales archaeon]
MMKRRIHVAIFISMLLPFSLTACASASKVKLSTSSGAANYYFGNSVSISGNETILSGKLYIDSTVKYS